MLALKIQVAPLDLVLAPNSNEIEPQYHIFLRLANPNERQSYRHDNFTCFGRLVDPENPNHTRVRGTNVYSALDFSKAKARVETHWWIMNMDLEHGIVKDTGKARGHSRETGGGARREAGVVG